MRRVTIVSVGFVLSGFLLCQGCSVTSMPTGPDVRANYAWGTLSARLDYPIDDAYRAASDAVQQLDLDVLRYDQDGVAAEIDTVDAQRETITIEMEALPGARTLLAIRADVFGDRNKSEVVFEQIVANLRGESPTAKR